MGESPTRQPALGFIFVTVTLAIVGFGLLIPVLPKLIVEFQHGNVTAGSHTYGWIVSIFALMQFICSPILGALSDQYGRRRIILIATAGSAIDYFIMANAPTLAWLFVARIIAGGTAGVLSTANAYIADVTPPEKRAGAFGMLGAAFGIGFIVGPLAGGLLGEIEIRLPFYVAGTCSALNWAYGYFALPESLAAANRRAFSWQRANPIGALLALKRFPGVLGLAESYFILMMAQSMMFTTWALYTDYRYHWSPSGVGLSLMFVGVLSGFVQAVLVRRIVPRMGESRAVILGLSVAVLTYISYGLAAHGWIIYVAMVFGAFAGISGPALQSYITKHVPPNEQGAVQGVYAGLASLAGIPGPFIATWSFGWAIAPGNSIHLPGIAFFEAALLITLALGLAARCFGRDANRSTPPAVPAPVTPA